MLRVAASQRDSSEKRRERGILERERERERDERALGGPSSGWFLVLVFLKFTARSLLLFLCTRTRLHSPRYSRNRLEASLGVLRGGALSISLSLSGLSLYAPAPVCLNNKAIEGNQ